MAQRKNTPVILDTDWHTDCDDAVAVRILANAQRAGAVKILGIGIDSAHEYSARSLCAFLEDEGIFDVPIGIDHGSYGYGGEARYQPRLAQRCSKAVKNEDCEEAVSMYRRLLSESEGGVEIMGIGFTQILAALVESGPDEYSSLDGASLIKSKVSKLWLMGGKWDGSENAKEFNFSKDGKASLASHTVLETWPTPITLLGFEVGHRVMSGGVLEKYEGDALYGALVDYGVPKGRHSWDPMLVLMACIGDEGEAGYDTVCGRASVCAQTGVNYFQRCADGRHRYVVKKYENAFYERQIDEILTLRYAEE